MRRTVYALALAAFMAAVAMGCGKDDEAAADAKSGGAYQLQNGVILMIGPDGTGQAVVGQNKKDITWDKSGDDLEISGGVSGTLSLEGVGGGTFKTTDGQSIKAIRRQ
ncbi:MAG: hypothetical protein GF320_21975 [Armatimonadia bacterium]|nr:hypothetical protein [Armatimonadia bacterium]